MDETKWRAYRWTADNAHQFFWLIWGIGVGGFVVVSLGAANLPADIVRGYFGILLAAMTAVFGLVSARAMDSISDRRKRRRKFFNMKKQIELLVRCIDDLCAILKDHAPEHACAPHEPPNVRMASALVLAAQNVKDVSLAQPDFDDETDFNAAYNIEVGLTYFRQSYELLDMKKILVADDEAMRRAGPLSEATSALIGTCGTSWARSKAP